jgi:maltose/moltooligosaccharide transporter
VITGFGIGWASMMGIPYLVIHHSERTLWGLYGNHKYDDCDPYVYSNHHVWIRTQKLLNNDPRLAISFAGVLLLISAGCTLLLIKTKRRSK